MSKSMLIIDTPKTCFFCRCYNGLFDRCIFSNESLEDIETKPDWCPLREVSDE